jgi:hypothetical protein
MSDLFKAKRPDGRSDWRVVFDRVAQLQPGEEISHKELLEELGTTDRTVLYRAVSRANRELWKTKLRSLDAVRGKGYRLLHANEHTIQAEGYKTKSRRQMGNALAVMEATDLEQLDSEGRNWALQVTAGMRLLASVLDQHTARLARHDALLAEMRDQIQELQKGR